MFLVCERARFWFLSRENVPSGSANRYRGVSVVSDSVADRVLQHVRPKTSDAGHRLAPHFQSAAGIRLRQVRRSDFQRRVCVVRHRGQPRTLFETTRVNFVFPIVCRQSKGQIFDGKSRNHYSRAQND